MKNKSAGRTVFKILNAAVLCVFSFVCILPFWHLLMSSLSDVNELAKYDGVVWWPRCEDGLINLEGYIKFFAGEYDHKPLYFVRGAANSLFYIAAGGALCVVLSYCAALCIRLNGKWSKAFWTMIIFSAIYNVGVIPSYIAHRSIGLVDNRWGVIMMGLLNCFYIACILTAVKRVPRELEDAAVMDGAGTFMVLFKIIFPLTKAAAAAVFFIFAVSKWNEYLYPATYLNDSRLYPVQVAVYYYAVVNIGTAELDLRSAEIDHAGVSQMIRCAITFAAVVPMFITYPLVSKWLKKDIAIGSIKE